MCKSFYNPKTVIANSRSKNVTMILAINSVNMVSSEEIINSEVNAEIFKSFLSNLDNILGRDNEYIMVMNNVRFNNFSMTNFKFLSI